MSDTYHFSLEPTCHHCQKPIPLDYAVVVCEIDRRESNRVALSFCSKTCHHDYFLARVQR